MIHRTRLTGGLSKANRAVHFGAKLELKQQHIKTLFSSISKQLPEGSKIISVCETKGLSKFRIDESTFGETTCQSSVKGYYIEVKNPEIETAKGAKTPKGIKTSFYLTYADSETGKLISMLHLEANPKVPTRQGTFGPKLRQMLAEKREREEKK